MWFLKLVLLELIVQNIWGPLKLIFQHDTEIFGLPAKHLDSLVMVASTGGTIRELLSGDDTILGKKEGAYTHCEQLFSANTTLENKREHTHTVNTTSTLHILFTYQVFFPILEVIWRSAHFK